MYAVFHNQKNYSSLSLSKETTAGDDVFDEQAAPRSQNRSSNSNWHLCVSYGVSILLTIALIRQSVLSRPADSHLNQISGHDSDLDLYCGLRKFIGIS